MEGMKDNHKKRMRKAVELARDKIINNVSAEGTNDAVPDLSTNSPIREYFDEKKTGMTGIECKNKDREAKELMRATREEVTKSTRDELCSTLQHMSEATRKDHKWLARDAMESMRYQVRKYISREQIGREKRVRELESESDFNFRKGWHFSKR